MFLIDLMLEDVILLLLAPFGFSNHIYGDENAFEKTRHGCQLFEAFLKDLTNNYTKPITDESSLINRALSLLSDSTM